MTTTLDHGTAAAPLAQRLAVRFTVGMPGFEQYTRFTLEGIDDGPIFWLACDDEPEIALPVGDIFAIEPRYAFDLPDADAQALGLSHSADALVLAVLYVPRGAGAITANLFAPIIMNRATGLATQLILDGSDYSLRHPVAVVS